MPGCFKATQQTCLPHFKKLLAVAMMVRFRRLVRARCLYSDTDYRVIRTAYVMMPQMGDATAF
jgi:hypothetical protein